MIKSLAIGVALAGLLDVGVANATLYEYTYVDTISSAGTPGISAGDKFTLDLFVNSTSASDQSWGAGNTAGFTIAAGTYHASYSAVWSANFSLRTDAAGNVSSIAFYGTDYSSKNVDNFGSWTGDTVYGDADFVDSRGNDNTVASNTLNNVGQWTFDGAVDAPEPASVALLGAGLFGLGMVRRRRA